jgi:hypothetical protein
MTQSRELAAPGLGPVGKDLTPARAGRVDLPLVTASPANDTGPGAPGAGRAGPVDGAITVQDNTVMASGRLARRLHRGH